MKEITVLMVGVGGYGAGYVDELLHAPRTSHMKLVGAVDPYAEKSRFYEELKERKIPIYDTLEEFYLEHTAQMAVISTPIHLHTSQANYCMEHGSDVLCEKPICASLEDAKAMIETRDRTGRKLAIGFQWSYSEANLQLKQHILDGMYGKIKRFRTIVYYPRNLDYYNRGIGWAGKRRMPSGELLLDSVASNATAHFLHNMLFLTGNAIDRSAEPVSIEAEVYKVNPIEMFDTCAMDVRTGDDVELMFYATHAVPMDQNRNPEYVIEAELGTITLTQEADGEHLVGHLNNGQTICYDKPSKDTLRKLLCMGDAVASDAPLSCVPETAIPHLKCICALADAVPETPGFPEEFICFDEEKRQYTIRGLGQDLDRCWKEGVLPSKAGCAWAKEAVKIVL